MKFQHYVFILLIGFLPLVNANAITQTDSLSCQYISENCLNNCCPTGTMFQNIFIPRAAYALSNNASTKFADWVAYRTLKGNIGKQTKRKWHQDPKLNKADTLSPTDYKSAHAILGYDRGHQAPLGHFGNLSKEIWQETNYLSNITPQKSTLNQGPWRDLELKERELAQQGYDLYVLTGPLYEASMLPLPYASKRHDIPSAYWKVIAIQDQGITKLSAFIMPQSANKKDDFCSYHVPLDEVAMRSHLNLYPLTVKNTETLAHALKC
ncbi:MULTISPECIES: DNA/RNA non-specific endonuclease [Cysteiniphilum]|uniref:DNA/RNA non-specific endonuclease n=1 Tax=Cysteiniphilum TaxID=2056696 RepID=UPI00177EAC47|nr:MULTISPECIES: DNA/RNA non-specific endonuclease [Cysteiniphilum]